MQFRSDGERDAYFLGAAESGGVRPGSWIEHAGTADLGIWGNEGRLAADCARIAAEEIRRLTGRSPDPLAVQESRLFRAAFSKVRQGPEALLADAVESLLMRSHGGDAELVGRHPLMQQFRSRRGDESSEPGIQDLVTGGQDGEAGAMLALSIADEIGCWREPRAEWNRAGR
jgi:hypothetical protein